MDLTVGEVFRDTLFAQVLDAVTGRGRCGLPRVSFAELCPTAERGVGLLPPSSGPVRWAQRALVSFIS